MPHRKVFCIRRKKLAPRVPASWIAKSVGVPGLLLQCSNRSRRFCSARMFCFDHHPRLARSGPLSPEVLRYATAGGDAMYFEQFYLGCLAHASYMLASEGEAVVVDPQRDVDIYLKAADEQGVRIRHIFETHLHADFVSGHRELADRTGATIYIGPHGGARFARIEVQDGFQLRVEKIRIQVLATPGHTPESICLVVTDNEKSAKPWAVLTGDTLFIGDVGRPDLSESRSEEHTSELQSRFDLVCRLLLEKKKHTRPIR